MEGWIQWSKWFLSVWAPGLAWENDDNHAILIADSPDVAVTGAKIEKCT